jgi:hypothetical protein
MASSLDNELDDRNQAAIGPNRTNEPIDRFTMVS